MKKQSRQQMQSMKSQHQPPQIQHPKYIELEDTSLASFMSATSSSTLSVSIRPPEETPNIQTYRDYINELSNRLQEDENIYAEELDIEDSMPKTSQYQQESSLEIQTRSCRGSGHYNGRVKDSMIENHNHQSARVESDEDSEVSSYNDEEAYLPMNPPSSSHQRRPTNNFFISSQVKLNPRANLYLLIILTFIIAISSLVVGNDKSTPRSSSERAALFFISTSLLIATAIGFSFRYAPLRIYITRPYSFFTSMLGQLIDSREKVCGIVLLVSTIIVCGIGMHPRANLAVAWNYKVLHSPMYYSTWVSMYTCVIIVADMFTQDESHWIIARNFDGDGGIVPRSTAMKAWLVCLFSNFAVSGTLYSACSSGLYENYRTKVLVAGFLGICGGLISVLLLGLHHMVSKAQKRAHSYGTWNSTWEGPNSQKHLNSLGLGLGIVVLVLDCTIVALVSPLGPGSIMLPCWVAFIVSIMLCKHYVESSLVEQPHNNLSTDICSHSDRSKGTQITLESNYIDSCDEDETDVNTSTHEEFMDRLRTLSVSVAGQQEPEEEIYPPRDVPPTERTQQEPEEEVLPNASQEDTVSLVTKPPTKSRKETKTNAHAIPPPPQSTRDSKKVPSSPKFPPPPPTPPPPFGMSKRASSRTCDDFVRLSIKSPAEADALVADALRHALSSRVMSDSDESSEQRRDRRIEISNLLKKVDSEFQSPPPPSPHASFSSRSKEPSSSDSSTMSSIQIV